MEPDKLEKGDKKKQAFQEEMVNNANKLSGLKGARGTAKNDTEKVNAGSIDGKGR